MIKTGIWNLEQSYGNFKFPTFLLLLQDGIFV